MSKSTLSAEEQAELDSIINGYEEQKKAPEKGNNSSNNNYDTKNYFNTALPKDSKSGKKTIRILPPVAGNKDPYWVVERHSVIVDGKETKTICPSFTKKTKCPICDARQDLWDTYSEKKKSNDLDESTKKALLDHINKFKSRKAYIFRIIDRDHEDEGVKLWIINDDSRGQGNYNKIMDIYSSKKLISSIQHGRDLTINIALTTNPKTGKPSSSVSSILPEDESPLSENQEQIDAWLAEKTSWEPYFSTKPESWLSVVAREYTPVWSKELKTYVAKEETVSTNDGATIEVDDNDLSLSEESQSFDELPSGASIEDGGDDLPF